VELAATTKSLSKLVKLLGKADLVDAISGEGPFTALAPTNDAFDKLPKGTLESLKDDTAMLGDILKYHVIPGKVKSTDLKVGSTAMTVEGSEVEVTALSPNVMINKATVTRADIMASNGIIHLIDTVLIPPADEPDMNDPEYADPTEIDDAEIDDADTDPTDSSEMADPSDYSEMADPEAKDPEMSDPEMNDLPSIVDIATQSNDFTTLTDLLVKADLVKTLSGTGPFTVFAPTDTAFGKLPEATLASLGENPAALTQVLTYHVVPGKFLSTDLDKKMKVETAEGSKVKITSLNPVTINDAVVISADIEASNGVIHVIDKVLIPKDLAPDSSDE